ADLFWDSRPEGGRRSATPVPVSPAARRGATWAAGARTAVSVLRELRPSTGPTPFEGRVGRHRQVAFARCRLEDLRRIEHRAGEGVTVNDVVLATVAGAIRRWCRERGAPVEAARVKVPVSMHHEGPAADQPGNRDSFMFVDLP